jgi:membrane protease YdiL (CAAX protease family)
MIFELVIVLAVWRFAVRKFHLTWVAFGIQRPERGWPWLPFAIVVVAIAIVTFFGGVTRAFGWNPPTDLPDATYDNPLPLAIAFVLAVFFAPVAEEIFFRGFLFAGLIRKWGVVPAAIVTGAAFGSAHLFNPGGLYIFLPISLIGILFCWGYYYSRSLKTTIAAHFVFNLLQMIIAITNR